MRISQINNTGYNPSYKGITRAVYNPPVTLENGIRLTGILKHRNNSFMLRPKGDLCINQYNYLARVFPGKEKVNFYNYACSIGYESYGWIVWLLSGHEKHPERFFPVIAKDYDTDIINAAKNYILPLADEEIFAVKAIIKKGTFKDFFDVNYNVRDGILIDTQYHGYLARPTKKLTDNVQFSVADIREDYKNIEPERSIVLAANFWPYMEREDRYQLAENLYRQLAKGSLVKIGEDFDNNRISLGDLKSTAEILSKVGFKRTEEFKSIFRK